MKASFDIDTQNDFVVPGGALYGKGAERVIPVVAALNRYAADHGITLISSTCAHPKDAREFAIWTPHCMSTPGQQKPAQTLAGDRVGIDDCCIYGVFTEYCVKCAVMGSGRRGEEYLRSRRRRRIRTGQPCRASPSRPACAQRFGFLPGEALRRAGWLKIDPPAMPDSLRLRTNSFSSHDESSRRCPNEREREAGDHRELLVFS